MIKSGFYIITLLWVLVSCGTEKIAMDESDGVSTDEYPYIEHFHKGLRYKTTNRINEAVLEFEECLKIKQNDDAVYYALSKLELQRGNTLQSGEYIEKAAELDPGNTWYIQELAYMYFETADFEKSVLNFKKLVDIEPRNVDWLYGYAEALVNNGEGKKAIEALNKTEDLLGKHPDFSIQKFNLYLELNQKGEAENELLKAKEFFPKNPQIIAVLVDFYFKNNELEKATIMLEELVVADNSNGRAHLALADIYRQRGDMEKSYTELKLAYQSDDVDLETKISILSNVNKESQTIDPEIYEIVDILVNKYPAEGSVYTTQGDFLLRKNDEAGALIAYKKALEFDQSKYEIWRQVLIMEFQSGDYKELYVDSKECLNYFPSISLVYLLNGISSNQLKEYSEAFDVLTLGKEMVSNDPVMEAEFHGQLGEALFGLNEISDAIKSYQKAIQKAPDSRLIKNNFALRLATHKVELEMAESLIKQVVAEAPDRAEYIDTYGWVYFQQGKYAEALLKFDAAYQLYQKDKIIVEHIGDAMMLLGKKEQAIEWWTKALSMAGEDKELEKKIADKKYYESAK